MTDDPQHEGQHERLSPQDEAVRRRLAEARHEEPMPAAVTARLDDVLAGLQRDRAAERTSSNVVPISRPGRRRSRLTLLVAAAAVVVAGVGVAPIAKDLFSGSGSDDSAGSDGGVAADKAEPNAAAPSSGDSDSGATSEDEKRYLDVSGLPNVRSDQFRSDVLRVQAEEAVGGRESGATALAESKACESASFSAEQVLRPVRYDGNLAVLVFRQPVEDETRVDLFVCSTTASQAADTPDRSIVIPTSP